MSALSVRLPNSLHKNLKTLAQREGVSINALIASAVAEKLAALEAETYIQARAARASREAFDAALARVSDVLPALEDRV